MLRLRHPDGTTVEIPGDPTTFVEICDTNGDIAKLIYIDDNNTINVVTCDDPEADQYARLYDVMFVPIKRF